jgi:hypothetical protein
MKTKKVGLPSLARVTGAKPKALLQLPRLVRVTALEASEAALLERKLGENRFIIGNDWSGLGEVIQDPSVIALATLNLDGEVESFSISSSNGTPPTNDLPTRDAFAAGIQGARGLVKVQQDDGIVMCVSVDPKARRLGLGGAHMLGQLHSLGNAGCAKAWGLFCLSVVEGQIQHWDRTWNLFQMSYGFSERGQLGNTDFQAQVVDLKAQGLFVPRSRAVRV